MSLIDLNAARRERSAPESLPVTFGTETFELPAELPVDVFDPFLSEGFDLAGLIREGVAAYKADEDLAAIDPTHKVKGIAGIVVDLLFTRPSLPLDVIRTVFDSFETLFGAEQWAKFKEQRPTILDYAALFTGLYTAYGVSLGEAFASLAPSTTGGETPKETSASTPESTPATPSDAPASETASSESDD